VRESRLIIAAAACAAAATGGVLALAQDSPPVMRNAALQEIEQPPRGAPTSERLAALRAAVRARPERVDGHVLLAATELQGVRETADPSGYVRAEDEIAKALALKPGDQGALTERAQLELARHHFADGLRDADAARRVDPSVVRPYGPLVDANVELGHYGAAARALQAMVDHKPEFAGYTRVSYLRELHGDLDGALEALAAAGSAGGGTAESTAFADALTGGLELQRGRVGVAARSYRAAQAAFPSSGPAQIGLAKVEAARGRLGRAITRLRRLVGPRGGAAGDLLPLAELELAAGRSRAAAGHLARARAHQARETRSGVDVSVEQALLEADHGRPAEALALARRGMRGAPGGVRAEHALGWALTRAGHARAGLRHARRSLRLGWKDPLPLLHAGLAAAAAGSEREARAWLGAALRGRAWLGPWQAARGERALAALR
jgi:hypothetical protein